MRPSIEIVRPTLLVDPDCAKQHLARIKSRIESQGVAFRPHFKTHQSQAMGGWFRDIGVTAITVSSFEMADYFVECGWRDITVAFPVNILEISLINRLASQVHLNVIAEDPAVIERLSGLLEAPVGIFLKVDCGTHRTGLDPDDPDRVDACIATIADSPMLNWKGFLAHAGHTYHVRRDRAQLQAMYRESILLLNHLRDRYLPAYPDIIISFGDTPGASIAETFTGIDEMRPGNFIFYDLMQEQIGSCQRTDIAIALICPVVSVHPARGEFVVYGGAIHLSRESLTDDNGQAVFGSVVSYRDGKWDPHDEIGVVRRLSQEHGVVSIVPGVQYPEPGQLIAILPVHACLTAQCMRGYKDGAGEAYDHFAGMHNK